jgi:hypothetical protein
VFHLLHVSRSSRRYFLDCHSNSRGCDGGDPAAAMKMLESSHGLPSESDYPYVRVPPAARRHDADVCCRYRGNSSKGECPSHVNIIAGNVCRVEKVPAVETDIMCALFLRVHQHATTLYFLFDSRRFAAGITSLSMVQCQSVSTRAICSITAGQPPSSPAPTFRATIIIRATQM